MLNIIAPKGQEGEKKLMFDKFKKDEKGIQDAVNIVMALVMIVVVGAIGIFIADETMSAAGTPTNATLNNTLANLVSAGNTGSSFIVILIIAFIGGIAISYMFLMRGKTT